MPDAPPPAAPLRVALVCPYSLSLPGGVQGQVVGLARAYRERGHEVAVVAPVDDGEPVLPPGVRLVDAGRSVAVPANGSVAPVSLSPAGARRALRGLWALRPEVVHVHEPFAPGVPWGVLVARHRPPVVATFHRSGSSVLYRALRPALRRLGRRLAACCAVSSAARRTAEEVVEGPIEVLFNGIDLEPGAVEPWPASRPAVLFLGRHETRKGLGELLEAFEAVRRQTSRRPVLWVAGEGPATDALRQQWPAGADVEWLGVVTEEEKRRRLAAAEVLCAPSLGQESFGVVLLEGMAARAVVVASDLPGYREAAGDHAVFVPPGRPDALADALGGVLDGSLATDPVPQGGRPGGRQGWLDRAAARAAGFSMARLAARYEAVFARVVGGGPTGRS